MTYQNKVQMYVSTNSKNINMPSLSFTFRLAVVITQSAPGESYCGLVLICSDISFLVRIEDWVISIFCQEVLLAQYFWGFDLYLTFPIPLCLIATMASPTPILLHRLRAPWITLSPTVFTSSVACQIPIQQLGFLYNNTVNICQYTDLLLWKFPSVIKRAQWWVMWMGNGLTITCLFHLCLLFLDYLDEQGQLEGNLPQGCGLRLVRTEGRATGSEAQGRGWRLMEQRGHCQVWESGPTWVRRTHQTLSQTVVRNDVTYWETEQERAGMCIIRRSVRLSELEWGEQKQGRPEF